jgi:putative addiction module component (TIGR02574 family)
MVSCVNCWSCRVASRVADAVVETAALVPPMCSEDTMNPNQGDPVVDEIRETRHRISARFNHDPAQLAAHYQELQANYQERLINAEGTDSSETEESPPALSEAGRQEVARRSADYDAGRAETVSWQEIQARWNTRRASGG